MRFGIHNPSWLYGPDPYQMFEELKRKARWAEQPPEGDDWLPAEKEPIDVNKIVTGRVIERVLKAAGYTTGIFGKWHLSGKDGTDRSERRHIPGRRAEEQRLHQTRRGDRSLDPRPMVHLRILATLAEKPMRKRRASRETLGLSRAEFAVLRRLRTPDAGG